MINVNNVIPDSVVRSLRNGFEVGDIHIVNGPPAAGKSFYVSKHKAEDDIVIDMDILIAALSGKHNSYGYKRSSTAIVMADVIKNVVMSYADAITLKGISLWIIMCEPDSEEVHKVVDTYDADYVLLDVSREECERRIKNDKRRKGLDSQQVSALDHWFNFKAENKYKLDAISIREASEFFSEFKSFLDSENVDYFLSGSLSLHELTGMHFDRDVRDIDIYVKVSDIDKIKRYCQRHTFDFFDCRADISLFKVGHVIYFYPFENSSFHVGIFLFDRCDNEVVLYSHYIINNVLHEVRSYFNHDNVIARLFSPNRVRILPYEYVMVKKLIQFRVKDIEDFGTCKRFLNFRNIKLIKRSMADVRNEIYILQSDGIHEILIGEFR